MSTSYNPVPMMIFAALAATAAAERPSGETQERHENRITSGIDELLSQYNSDWSVAWAGLGKDGANFAYIASNASTSELAVVIRGTIFTPIDLLEDLDVGALVQFTAIPAGFSSEPLMVSQGAMVAFTEIMSMVSVAKGTTLGQELGTLTSSTTPTIYVTGHSLGGCIASMVALYLAADYLGNALPGIVAYTFAAPTAGTQAFADCYDQYVTNGQGNAGWRVYNAYDAVPTAWQTLADVENFYPSPGPTANQSVTGLIKSFLQSTNGNAYVQTNQHSNAVELNSGYTTNDPDSTCESVGDFLGQMGFQHANATYLSLLSDQSFEPIIVAEPSVDLVTPNVWPLAGYSYVTVTGTNFRRASEVDFGTVPAASVEWLSETELQVTPPAGIGVCDIRVTTIFGTSKATAADQFAWLPSGGLAAPSVAPVGPFLETALLPNSGPAGGGNSVTITGAGFVTGSTVAFGSTPATGVTIVSLTEIAALAPAGSGTVTVTVTSPSGTSSGASSSLTAYTYGAPLVTGLSPCCCLLDAEAQITISGSGFDPGQEGLDDLVAVYFDAKQAEIVSISPTQIVVTAPKSSKTAQNEVPVTVSVGGVSSGQTLASTFTYTSKI